MPGQGDRLAVALVLVAAGTAAAALALEVLGHGSRAAAIGFSVVGLAAGGVCLRAWASGARTDRRRLPLLLAGFIVPAFAAVALASATGNGTWSLALDGACLIGVAIAVSAVHRRRP